MVLTKLPKDTSEDFDNPPLVVLPVEEGCKSTLTAEFRSLNLSQNDSGQS